MNKLSEHFSWAEASITTHRNIDNTIPENLKDNIINTAAKMELVRGILATPILVSSWYRCFELNAAIGSNNATSAHPKGTAVDFISPAFGEPRVIVAKLMQHIKELQYDQLIFEHTWVHIGWDPSGKYRSQVLTLNHDGTYSNGLIA